MTDPFETKPVPDQPRPVINSTVAPSGLAKPKKPSFRETMASFYTSNKLYIWASVAGLLIIGLASYLVFHKAPTQAPTAAKVAVNIEAPETVASGGEAVYKINIKNEDAQKLVGLKLDLTYPDGMRYISSSPQALNISGTLFDVPDLIPGQSVAVIVKAKVAGNVNDTKELAVKLTYRLANFSSDFSTEARYGIRLTASNVSVTIEGPDSTSNAQLITYTVKYKNNSNEAIKNARLQLTYAPGFNFAAGQPNPSLGNNIWDISSLDAGAENSVSIQGTYASAQPGETKTVKADFLILSGSGSYFTQGSTSFNTQLSSLPLIVSQEVDARDYIANPGDTLNFHIKFQNNSTVPARGVNIAVTLDGKALDLSTVQAEGAQVNGSTISWNASSLNQLESLNPNEQGQTSFRVQLKNPATKDSSKNLSVTSSVKIKSNEYDTYFPGNQVQVKIATQASMSRQLSYQSGSMPPQVGKSTVYRVTVSLRNASNDISDAVVTGYIPLGAGGFDTGSVSPLEADKFQYDSSSGKFTWSVGSVPAHTGTFSGTKTVQFSVKLQAVSSQAGKNPTLVRDINFKGTDSFTGLPVTLSVDDLTTSDLQNGDYNAGEVQP